MGVRRSVIGLAVFLGLCFGAAWAGSMLTSPALPEWYTGLAKPSWTPSDWVFGPVWSLLYLMMGLAAWLVWRQAGLASAAVPMALFGLQLVLNVAWSGVFFGLRRPGAAFAEIILLWFAILASMSAFWRVTRLAGWLMLPYLLWVGYAASLNLAIWLMNR
jgi:tryptophan-rich sensory protein